MSKQTETQKLLRDAKAIDKTVFSVEIVPSYGNGYAATITTSERRITQHGKTENEAAALALHRLAGVEGLSNE